MSVKPNDMIHGLRKSFQGKERSKEFVKENGARLGGADDDGDSVARVCSTASLQSTASSLNSVSTDSTASGLPGRLVDFFGVVGAQKCLKPCKINEQKLKSSRLPTDFVLESTVVDCYPKSRPDMEFPRHSSFFFPNRCRASKRKLPPCLWTLVLTSASGHRLYGAVLTIYDEAISSQQFRELFQLDSFCDGIESSPSSTTNTGHDDGQMYHLPKCLVVLSHYAFFDVFRVFLQQLHRIFISGISPLPLERFIANFVDNVPLPPVGRAAVKWECFTTGNFVEIVRPPPNQLPMVNFSYEPLFRTLSASNILVLWGTLLVEGQVALYSKHRSLLTPVAEALLSLLFPLEWKGIYIPVLPLEMIDVLDAPVPYVVGVDQRYWSENKDRRPEGVVFVDLDEDIVHLGLGNGMPNLPDRPAMELKVQLEELTDHLFLVPSCGIKGRINTQDDQIMDNSVREPYAQMTRIHDGKRKRESNNYRKFIVSTAEHAFADKGIRPGLKRDDFVLSGKQQVMRSADSLKPTASKRSPSALLSMKRATRMLQAHTDRLFAFAGQQYAMPNPFNASNSDKELGEKRFQLALNFYELDELKEIDGTVAKISTIAIRRAFVTFFVNVLFRYEKFLEVGETGEVTMDRDAFVKDLFLSSRNKQYMSQLVGTQMFCSYLDDSKRKVFFDEQVVVEKNRASLFGSNQQPTPFLDDSRWKIRKIIQPKPACTNGVPRGTVFKFTKFPKLSEDAFHATPTNTNSFWTAFGPESLCSAWLCWPTS